MDHIPHDKRVVEHNDLVNARYDFSVLMSRLFVAGLLMIDKDDDELTYYRIPVKELVDAFEASTSYYSELKETAEELMRRSTVGFETVRKDGKRRFTYYPLFRKLSYGEGEGYIEVGFNPDLRPKLLELKGNFTQYELRYVKSFSSQYSYRIYKWLKQIEDLRPDRTLAVDDMRVMLMLEDKYPNFKDFRVNVIEVAQRELDEHADVSFDYELRRKGRKVTHVVFQIRASERSRRGMGPLFENGREDVPAPPRLVGPDVDDFDRWYDALSDEERARVLAEAERRMEHSAATGSVRDAERWRHLRALYVELNDASA